MGRSEMQLGEHRVKLSQPYEGQPWPRLSRSGKLMESRFEPQGVKSDLGFKEWHSKGATEEVSCPNSLLRLFQRSCTPYPLLLLVPTTHCRSELIGPVGLRSNTMQHWQARQLGLCGSKGFRIFSAITQAPGRRTQGQGDRPIPRRIVPERPGSCLLLQGRV